MNIDIDTVKVVAVLLLAQVAYRVKERLRNCSQCQKENIDFNSGSIDVLFRHFKRCSKIIYRLQKYIRSGLRFV